MNKTAVFVTSVLFIHAMMLGWVAYRYSPTWDEVAHLPSGISHWKFGDFTLYAVNPPLVRSVAALPLLFVPHEEDWGRFATSRPAVSQRSEFGIGSNFIKANGEKSFFLYTLGRWACIPFSLLAGYICWRWARELYGNPAGMLALIVWCFSPMVLAFGSLISPDIGCTALGITASYAFWKWLKKSSWEQTFFTGLLLGIAELTKYTLLVFYGFWPLMWLLWRFLSRKEPSGVTIRKQFFQLAVIFLISVWTINTGYAFLGSFERLDSYKFVSRILTVTDDDGKTLSNNRFRGTWMGAVPVPLPTEYVYGMDVQKVDFEKKLYSWFCGEWRKGGWYEYYIYGLFIKEPLGTWFLIVMATFCGLFLKGYTSFLRDEIVLLIPLFGLLIFVSSQNGFSHHMRYLLPAFPFAFIWLSKTARSFTLHRPVVSTLTVMALVWSVGSSLYYYPHSMSYFNELVDGPRNGHYHLANSNIDWGQDLLYLRQWLAKHPEVKLDSLGYDLPLVSPTLIGVDAPDPPLLPEPGWHVISVNRIHERGGKYEYFLNFDPTDRIGYSMNVYHFTEDEVNRIRHEMGLPEWAPEPEDSVSSKEVQ
jgi:4-amino-4-deoxy-L-arabinose transferase and related glycosyltransferases of PMT family